MASHRFDLMIVHDEIVMLFNSFFSLDFCCIVVSILLHNSNNGSNKFIFHS